MSIQGKLNELINRRQQIELMGGVEAINKIHKDGKMTSRERVHALLDENSFVEIGAFVTQRATNFNLEGKELPADGVVTGYGTIEGRLVYVYSQDATILGGAIGEMHAKKIVTLYDLALKMGAPIIGLLDSAGLRLQEATDALDAFGQIYVKQANVSGVIPQITAILGNCGGGTSIMTSLSDFTFMTKKNSKLYVNSPTTFNDTKEGSDNLTSAEFNASTSGLVDVVCEDDMCAISCIRELVELLPSNNKEEAPFAEVTDDPNRISPELTGFVVEGSDGLSIIITIADNQYIFEVKKDYGQQVVTALGRLNGVAVGFIANQSNSEDEGRLTTDAMNKVAEFVSFCDAFSLPIVTISDVIGYAAAVSEEKKGLAKAAAAMTHAFVSATVPKINVLVKRGFGSAYVSFNSKHIGADCVLAWPTAEVAMMDAKNAVKIMYASEIEKAEIAGDVIIEKTKEFEAKQSSAYAAASRGFIDDIIEPAATRKRVIIALEMLYSKSIVGIDRKHSTI
jgi:methylmalonyl-CoA decarboxylase subunit alpha